jgi:tripartite-type tricarboxylate transporter receptor subunit TctC
MVAKSVMSMVCGTVLLGLPGVVCGQAYPSKTIRIVVPFLAGGASDYVGRLVSTRLPELVQQQVIVENRAGAGGTLGAEQVARAAPDGYTLLLGNIGVVSVAPSIFSKLAYDPVKDFAGISNLVAGPSFVLAHPALPARNIKELIALAKARPGELNFASAGPGQVSHISGELFKMMTGVNITFVFYKGQAAYVPELVGGHIPLTFSTIPEMLPFVQSGKLRALAVTSARRIKVAPEVPTMEEAGVPGYEVLNWNGILAPAATPRDIINRLNRDIVRIMQNPELRQLVESQGNFVVADTPAEFTEFIRRETEKWGKVMKQAGVKLD